MAVRAQEGGRLSQLIEIKLLQAVTYGMRDHKGEEEKALTILAEALQLGEAEGFIRSFVDEGPLVASLLSQLRDRERRGPRSPLDTGTLSYLDQLLDAFEKNGPSTVPSRHEPIPIQAREQKADGYLQYGEFLVEPLSQRELEVLLLVAKGASNADIADHLVIALNTVKRHISNIFEKLGVSNRTQAVAQARSFGILEG